MFFLDLVAKTTVFIMFLGQWLAKHWYLRSFHHVARSIFSVPKAQKHCKLPYFGSWRAPKKKAKIRQKASKGPSKT
jgi:hypothetical protein